MGEEEVGLQVHAEHEVPIRLGVLDCGCSGVDTGIVDQDVDAAELCRDLADDAIDLRQARRITRHDEAFAAEVAHGGRRLVQLGGRAARDRHISTVLGEADGDGATKTTAAAGDDGPLAGEVEQGGHGTRCYAGSEPSQKRRTEMRKRAAIALATLVAAELAVGLGAPHAVAAVVPSGFTDAAVASLGASTGIVGLPDGTVLVLEQAGRVRLIRNDQLLAAPALTIGLAPCNSGERGLLGVAVDPDFRANGWLYLYFTRPSDAPGGCVNRVSRFTLAGDTIAPGQ